MSSLNKIKRRLNPKRVYLANKVAEEKINLAKQILSDRLKKNEELMAEVLKAAANLPPEFKDACKKTITDDNAKKLREKWEACELVTGDDVKSLEIIESQSTPLVTPPPKELSARQRELIKKWEKTGLLDGIKGEASLNPALLIESQEKMPMEKIIVDEQGTENIRPPQESTPTDEELRKFVIVGQSPAEDIPLGDGFVSVQSDGGDRLIVSETDLPNCPRDGE